MVWLKQTILGHEIPKESMHYTCITCITIDSVWEWKIFAGLFRRMQGQNEKDKESAD